MNAAFILDHDGSAPARTSGSDADEDAPDEEGAAEEAPDNVVCPVEAAQRSQFLEFSGAWDNYMSDYEATAYLSLEKLKEKHTLEI